MRGGVKLSVAPVARAPALAQFHDLLVGSFHGGGVEGANGEIRLSFGRNDVGSHAALCDDAVDPHVLAYVFAEHVGGVEGQNDRVERAYSLVGSHGRVGREAGEIEFRAAHGEHALVERPAGSVSGVGDEDEVRALEIASLEEGDLSATARSTLLVGSADHENAAGKVGHLRERGGRHEAGRGDEVVAAGVAVREGIVLEHYSEGGAGALSEELGPEGCLGYAAGDEVGRDGQIAPDGESERLKFLLEESRRFEFLLSQFPVAPDRLTCAICGLGIRVDGAEDRLRWCRPHG